MECRNAGTCSILQLFTTTMSFNDVAMKNIQISNLRQKIVTPYSWPTQIP